MNTAATATGTVVLVVVGTWSQNKPLTPKIALGSAAFFLALSMMGSAGPSAKLAEQFGTLVLIAAAIRYIPDIAKKTGLANAK